eukprot:sb/3470847/
MLITENECEPPLNFLIIKEEEAMKDYHIVKVRDQGDFLLDKNSFEPILEFWREAGVTEMRRPPMKVGGPKSDIYLVEVYTQNPQLTAKDLEAPGISVMRSTFKPIRIARDVDDLNINERVQVQQKRRTAVPEEEVELRVQNALAIQKSEFENYFKNQMSAQAALLRSQFETRFSEAALTLNTSSKEEETLLNMDGS